MGDIQVDSLTIAINQEKYDVSSISFSLHPTDSYIRNWTSTELVEFFPFISTTDSADLGKFDRMFGNSVAKHVFVGLTVYVNKIVCMLANTNMLAVDLKQYYMESRVKLIETLTSLINQGGQGDDRLKRYNGVYKKNTLLDVKSLHEHHHQPPRDASIQQKDGWIEGGVTDKMEIRYTADSSMSVYTFDITSDGDTVVSIVAKKDGYEPVPIQGLCFVHKPDGTNIPKILIITVDLSLAVFKEFFSMLHHQQGVLSNPFVYCTWYLFNTKAGSTSELLHLTEEYKQESITDVLNPF